MSKICNFHDSASLVVDCKSLTLGWISLSLYKVVVDSIILDLSPRVLTGAIFTELSTQFAQNDKLHDLFCAFSDYDVKGKHAVTATSYG